MKNDMTASNNIHELGNYNHGYTEGQLAERKRCAEIVRKYIHRKYPNDRTDKALELLAQEIERGGQ